MTGSLFLSGVVGPRSRPLLDDGRLGLLNTPRAGYVVDPRWVWAADSGCFSPDTYVGDDAYLSWLTRLDPARCLWATAPDVVADWPATLARSAAMRDAIAAAGYVVALVLQDGATVDTVPWSDYGAVFVGGSTAWKLGPDPLLLLAAARARGLATHVGRVNTARRWARFAGLADTMDGTRLAFEPDLRLDRWADQLTLSRGW